MERTPSGIRPLTVYRWVKDPLTSRRGHRHHRDAWLFRTGRRRPKGVHPRNKVGLALRARLSSRLGRYAGCASITCKPRPLRRSSPTIGQSMYFVLQTIPSLTLHGHTIIFISAPSAASARRNAVSASLNGSRVVHVRASIFPVAIHSNASRNSSMVAA